MQPFRPASEKPASPWNPLERTKLAVDIVKTAASLLLTGAVFWLGSQSTRDAQVVKKRVEIWDKVAPDVYAIYCYNLHIENWQTLNDSDIASKKREADQYVYAYRPFFTKEFFNSYAAFMESAFELKHTDGTDVVARISPTRCAAGPCAGAGYELDRKTIHATYYTMLAIAAKEFGVTASAEPLTTSEPR